MSVVITEAMSNEWSWMADFVANLRYRLGFFVALKLRLRVQLVLLFTNKPEHISTHYSSLHFLRVTKHKIVNKRWVPESRHVIRARPVDLRPRLVGMVGFGVSGFQAVPWEMVKLLDLNCKILKQRYVPVFIVFYVGLSLDVTVAQQSTFITKITLLHKGRCGWQPGFPTSFH